MQDWLIWIGTTAITTLFGFLMSLLAHYSPELAGFVALIVCILIMVFIVPMAF